MAIKININTFYELQGNMNETEFSKLIGIDRTWLWKLKQGAKAGEQVIIGFKKAFPDKKFEDYFTIEA